MSADEKQCRICLDGANAEPELGRLIRPCLCKGSISVSDGFVRSRRGLSHSVGCAYQVSSQVEKHVAVKKRFL